MPREYPSRGRARVTTLVRRPRPGNGTICSVQPAGSTPRRADDSTAQDTAIDTVVFDLGGVLIDWDVRALFGPRLPDPADVAEFLRRTDFMAWNLEHDRGADWAIAVAAIRESHPTDAEVFAVYPDFFEEALVGLIPGTQKLLAELRSAGIRLLALTNFARGNFEVARAKYPWLADFDGIVVSSHEGLVKPDERIYRILFDRYAVQPGTSVFVDDRPENLATARALGMHCCLFTDADALRQELRQLGLPLASGG